MAQIFNGDHWMGSIAGGTLLSALSIPGTHESCARYGGVAFECQTLTVAEQLDLGIRCFDIRCRHYYDHFPIHHSDTYEHLDFGEVMDACSVLAVRSARVHHPVYHERVRRRRQHPNFSADARVVYQQCSGLLVPRRHDTNFRSGAR